jgi:hypothetical protein
MQEQGWKRVWVRGALAVLMLLTATVGSFAPAAHAQELSRATPVWTEDGEEPPAELERWWGAAGALLCGLEVRLIMRAPAIGMNPYMLAAGIGGCILALIDIQSTT